MTPFMDAVQAVLDCTHRPIATYDAFPTGDAQLLQDLAYKSLLQLCHKAKKADRDGALISLAPAIAAAPDAFQASRLAMLCGILVEWGASPNIAIGAILTRLPSQLRAAQPIDDTNAAALFAEQPDAVKAWKGLRYLCMAAMTMLCLDGAARQRGRSDAALLDAVRALAPMHREVKFLQRLFDLADGLELIVLHPQAQKGYRVRLEAIASNFHLFTLLQAAIAGDLGTPRPSRMVLGTATGEIPHDRIVSDVAHFHFATWTALQPDGTLSADGATGIRGEDSPRAIPESEGERIVLVGPPQPGARAWDSSFFTNLHDALRSKVEVIEVLSAGEVDLRLARIRKAPRDTNGVRS